MIENIPLPGINDFDKTFWENCSNNKLTNLDISKNTALWGLNCRWNKFDCEALKAKYNIYKNCKKIFHITTVLERIIVIFPY